ncbi:hypothetical protein SELMODRAFT_130207 [Selaginella moellendorffii]|uniref:Pentacotripeptide-repeat region of PRORP domain-containing protein n=2 Tax=Selaginella moellendorffii TaxID=88036 RepID=D8T1Y9_SELML|nr:hypothetical protein SELMODRAFT_130207 [Selaginella moellendorffii]
MPVRDSIAWTCLLVGSVQCGNSPFAIEMFHRMKTMEPPNETCFVAMLLACSHQGKVYDGRSYFTSMAFDHGLAATRKHYGCLIDLLGRSGYLEEARDLIAAMPWTADYANWTSFLGACREARDLKNAAFGASEVMGLGSRVAAPNLLLASVLEQERN